jgi:ATP-dependent helicase/nuclease subunit B
VTGVEALVKDPYAVYARRVLKLYRLDPPGRTADALSRGSAIHAALDAFVTATAEGLPPDAEAVFRDEVARAMALAAPWPAVNAIWTARLHRSARWFLDGEAERRARALPAAREVRGRRDVEGLARPFAVTAKADRVDRTPEGGYAIYDYKSGSAPSQAEIAAHHLQLQIEAAIAAAGGFEGLPAGPAVHLEYLGINGRNRQPVEADATALATFWERFRRLVATYQDPATPFVARLRPLRLKYGSDYDHLSRLGEWADGDPPDEAGW